MKTKITLEKGHYDRPDDTCSYVCDDTIFLFAPPGRQHIWSETHYDISLAQARKVARLLKKGYIVPAGIKLYYRATKKCDCPHCDNAKIVFDHESHC